MLNHQEGHTTNMDFPGENNT